MSRNIMLEPHLSPNADAVAKDYVLTHEQQKELLRALLGILTTVERKVDMDRSRCAVDDVHKEAMRLYLNSWVRGPLVVAVHLLDAVLTGRHRQRRELVDLFDSEASGYGSELWKLQEMSDDDVVIELDKALRELAKN